MALYYDLPVYRDTYKLILKIFECTKDFSKEFKYTLGQDTAKVQWNFERDSGKPRCFTTGTQYL